MTPLETEIERFKHLESEDHFAGCGHRTHPCPGAGYCGDEALIHALLAERDALKAEIDAVISYYGRPDETETLAEIVLRIDQACTQGWDDVEKWWNRCDTVEAERAALETRALAAEVALAEALELLTKAKYWMLIDYIGPRYGTDSDEPDCETTPHPLRCVVDAYLIKPPPDLTAAREIIAKAGRCDLAENTWICFHCDFSTADQVEAAAHFGDRDDEEPLCRTWADLNQDQRAAEYQSSLQELNGEREENARLRTKIEGLEYLVDGNETAISSRFKNCRTANEAFCLYDSMEGRALSAEEQRDTLAAQVATMRDTLKRTRPLVHKRYRVATGEVCYAWCPVCRVDAALALPATEAEKRVVQEDK